MDGKNRLMVFVLSSVLILSGFSTIENAYAQAVSSLDPRPVGATAISPPELCVGGETDLLIQDEVPWPGFGGGIDARGAFANELIVQGKNWCSIDSSAIGATDLSLFKVIILASDQPPQFYFNIMPGGFILPQIDTWVLNGGILSASLADRGTFGPDWFGSSFVGGLTRVFDTPNDITIIDAAHPLIANGLPCPGGNCAVVVDTGAKTDLDDFGSSAHAYFTNLPTGTNVILSSAGGPVAIEYPHGLGTVIANTLTDAWMYQGNSGVSVKKIIANDIAYQNSLVPPITIGGTFVPIDQSALLLAGVQSISMWMIPVILAGIGIAVFVIKRRK